MKYQIERKDKGNLQGVQVEVEAGKLQSKMTGLEDHVTLSITHENGPPPRCAAKSTPDGR